MDLSNIDGTLNPIVFYPAFPHIAKKIFAHLDNKSLSNCMEVAKPWKNCINSISWNEIIKNEGAVKAFEFAIKNGNFKILEILLDDLKPTEGSGNLTDFQMFITEGDFLMMPLITLDNLTPFQYACKNGHFKIVQKLIQKAIELNIPSFAYSK